MRIGELFALKSSDVGLEHKEISINATVSRAIPREDDSALRCIYELHNTKTKAGTRVILMNLWSRKAASIIKDELFI